MKSTTIFSGAFLGAEVAASAWGPHAPEVLVTDEIWQSVGKLLHDAEHVHFSLRADEVMRGMSVVRDDEGELFLTTRCVAYPTNVSAHRLAMLEARQMINSALASSIRNPARKGHACKTPNVRIEIAALDSRSFEIRMYESVRIAGSERNARPEKPAGSSSSGVDGGQQAVAYEATLSAAS